ncbi:hypothetical protein IWQ62_003816 [Dispira parvispora]|uniref:S-adenosyl-L-methionine-dependent methyltransferase n=1 Tax=Dispira parvispora TaxID=1520584 RepID=A0A9W8E5Z3_9FUNG|nr:hypothetical protein IWQ62_003816 [Dispira parvispora]
MTKLSTTPLRSSLLLPTWSRLSRPRAFHATTTAIQGSHYPQVFDRQHKFLQRERAATDAATSRQVDYLRDEVAHWLVDRLRDIKRRHGTIVELGAHSGHLAKHLDRELTDTVIQCDASPRMLYRDQHQELRSRNGVVEGEEEIEGEGEPVNVEYRVMDEEKLDFKENSVEAIVSNLSLHWVNDLRGTLVQIRRALVPDGMFLGAMLGGDTLFELRTSLQLAELEREGGISPRVSPMANPRDMTDLLSQAGFTLTTVDVDELVVNYPSPLHLMQDLRAMGESNAVLQRRPYLPRDTLMAASSIYNQLHGNEDGTVPATFQIIFLIGWKPHSSQPQPKPRGSATTSLKDILS